MIEAGRWGVEDTEYCKTNETHRFTGARLKGAKKNDNLKAVDEEITPCLRWHYISRCVLLLNV